MNLRKGEELQWLCVDSRLPDDSPARNCGEWRKCKNGHTNFISSYMPLEKKTIINCRECGIEIFRFAPFAVRYRELEDV